MICKTFELRDRQTFIPLLAVFFDPANEHPNDEYLLRRAGYGANSLIVCNLNSGESRNDAYDWPEGTVREAHVYLLKHFQSHTSGDVVDVEFIRGDTTSPKKSEKLI